MNRIKWDYWRRMMNTMGWVALFVALLAPGGCQKEKKRSLALPAVEIIDPQSPGGEPFTPSIKILGRRFRPGRPLAQTTQFQIIAGCSREECSIQIFIDENPIKESRGSGGLLVEVNPRTLSDGEHRLVAVIRDQKGQDVRREVTFLVANPINQPPVIVEHEVHQIPYTLSCHFFFKLFDPDGDPIDWVASLIAGDGELGQSMGSIERNGLICLTLTCHSRGRAEVILNINDRRGGLASQRAVFDF